MTKIRNLTGSPYDLAPGVILPALGEVETDALPDYMLEILAASPGVEIVAVTDEKDSLEEWRKMYYELTGKDADKRWSEETLISKIEKASA